MSPNALVPLLVIVPRPFVVLARFAQLLTLPDVNRVAAPRTAERLQIALLVHPCVDPAVRLIVDRLTLVKSTAPPNPLAELDTLTIVDEKFPSALYNVAMFPSVVFFTKSLNVVVPLAIPDTVPMVLLVPLATCIDTTVSSFTSCSS